MANIQCATAEIRRGNKKRRKKKPQQEKIIVCPIPQEHRQNKINTAKTQVCLLSTTSGLET